MDKNTGYDVWWSCLHDQRRRVDGGASVRPDYTKDLDWKALKIAVEMVNAFHAKIDTDRFTVYAVGPILRIEVRPALDRPEGG